MKEREHILTENQWTTAGQSFPHDTTAVPTTTPAASPDAGGGSQSKKDAVKDETSSVAGEAVAAAQGVAKFPQP